MATTLNSKKGTTVWARAKFLKKWFPKSQESDELLEGTVLLGTLGRGEFHLEQPHVSSCFKVVQGILQLRSDRILGALQVNDRLLSSFPRTPGEL